MGNKEYSSYEDKFIDALNLYACPPMVDGAYPLYVSVEQESGGPWGGTRLTMDDVFKFFGTDSMDKEADNKVWRSGLLNKIKVELKPDLTRDGYSYSSYFIPTNVRINLLSNVFEFTSWDQKGPVAFKIIPENK